MDCTSTALMEGAKCIEGCTSPGQRDAIKLYLLATIAGVSVSSVSAIESLKESSKCLNCLLPAQSKAIEAYLLCTIATQLGA